MAELKIKLNNQDSPMTPEEAKHLRERWAYLQKRDKVLTELEVWLEEDKKNIEIQLANATGIKRTNLLVWQLHHDRIKDIIK